MKAAIAGHPKLIASLKKFVALTHKKIIYLLGNHDADLFFEKVREYWIRACDPEGSYPSQKIQVIWDTDRLVYADEGIEIHHGNQFEAGNALDFKYPFLRAHNGQRTLNFPWGSIYVLKIINRLKWERQYIDKIRPIKIFVFFALIFDPWFTVRFIFLSCFYFVKTRLFPSRGGRLKLKNLVEILKEETLLFRDLERQARKILDSSNGIQTVIFGHTHRPMMKFYPDGKQYINTGAWTKMLDLDLRVLGQQTQKNFALIRIRDGKIDCELRQWVGEHSPHKIFNG